MLLVAARATAVGRLDAGLSAGAWRFAVHHPAWRAAMAATTTTDGPRVIAVAATVAVVLLGLARHRRDAGAVAIVAAAAPIRASGPREARRAGDRVPGR